MNSLKMMISTKFICVLILAFIVSVRASDTRQVAYRDSKTFYPTIDESEQSNCHEILLSRHESYHQREIRFVYNIQPILYQWVNIKLFEGEMIDKKVIWFQENVPVNQPIDIYKGIKINGAQLHLCFYVHVKKDKYGLPQHIDWSIWE